MKEFFSNIDRKTLVIGAACILLTVALVIGAVIFILVSGKDSTEDHKDDSTETTDVAEEEKDEFDTSLVGDGEGDPENQEFFYGDGAEINADSIKAENGISFGIDVSKWQGKIDWNAVADTGIDFAYIRIGYRGENGTIYKDDNADYNIQMAEKAGILVGVYFFSTAVDEKEALEEARWTLQAISGYGISYPVVYDCEGFRSPSSRMYLVSREQRTANALAFMKTVADAGYESMLYGAKNDLENGAYWDISKIEEQYKVWVAQYSAVTYPEKQKPDHAGRVDAWQYTNRGSVSGITGNVDMVVCYFEREYSEAKKPSKRPADAKAPLTDEEKIYTEVYETVTAKDVTNLRSAPTTKSDIVKVLNNGEKVVRVGIGSNGWSKLSLGEGFAYAITSYLTTDLTLKAEPPADQDVVLGQVFSERTDSVTAKEYVNLRKAPSTEAEIVAVLEKGTYISRTAVSDKGWSRLLFSGTEVYAVTSYLTTEMVEADTAPPSTESVPSDFTEVDEQVTAKAETNLRSAPSTTTGEVVYTLKKGEYVRRTGVNSKGWSRIEYNGQTLYAVSTYLTLSEIDEEGFEVVDEQVTAKSVTNLRSAPDTKTGEVVYALKNGEYVKRIGVHQNGWSKLLYNGQIVYAVTSYLTE